MRGHRGGGPLGRRGFQPGHHHEGPHHHHHGEKIGRLLGHGDLRYVILSLLEKKPRHGYELIKALEDLSSGAYSPSPGTIYPTLTFLQEGGFASVKSEDNKNLYTITKEGTALLDENREFVTTLLERFAMAAKLRSRLNHWMGRDESEGIAREEKSPIRRAMHGLKAELFSFTDATKSEQAKVAELIDGAVAEIRKLKS